ncbi:MAG TPA: hypothetical protein PKM88_11285, partial [bacterium]|nr:hypothetical protein [bacterium]
RGEILRQITDANALLDGLVAKRLLHETEASLLKADLVEQRRQLEDVWADTGDERTAADMCYLRLQAKKESLSMLGEYCEHPAAIRESLDAVRRDLTYISIERQQQNITVTHDTVAVSQLVAQVSESMQQIDQRLLLFAASTYRELPASITTPPPANTTDEH